MRTTKVFICGNSQAVRLPKDLQFHSRIVTIVKRNNEIVLREAPENLAIAFKNLTPLPADALSDAKQDSFPQERDLF